MFDGNTLKCGRIDTNMKSGIKLGVTQTLAENNDEFYESRNNWSLRKDS